MLFILMAVAFLLVGAVLSLLLKGSKARVVVSLVSQVSAVGLVLLVACPVLFTGENKYGLIDWSYPVNIINLRLDPLSSFFLAFSLPLTLLGSIYGKGYLREDFRKKRNPGVHYALLNMVSLSYILIYLVENAIAFLLGWEIAALSAWLLVIWDYRNQRIRFAGFNYLVSTHVGLLFLIAAFMLMHSSTNSFDFSTFKVILAQPGPYRNIIFLLLVTSFSLKSAFFPFHTWLPRAHSAAPAHVSALMSGVIHKAGIYGMLRFTLLINQPDEWMGWYLIGFSSLSAFMGVLYTVTQRDLKRLLGYSSTENVGIAGIGIGLGYLGICWNKPLLTALGFTAAILHVLNHALFKCLLFYAAGCVYRMTHTVDIERLGGLIRKMPQTAMFYLIGGLAISAVPPFNGFVSEFLIYNGLLRDWQEHPVAQLILIAIAALLSIIGGISVIAFVRSFGVTFLGELRDSHHEPSGEASRLMRAPMALHVIGILILGLYPVIGMNLVHEVTKQFVRVDDAIAKIFSTLNPLFKMNLYIFVVVAAFWGIRKIFLNNPRRHVTWACGYSATNTRMQYTGSSFSDPFVGVFQFLLRLLKRENLPRTLFPTSAYLNTHFVDAIERRMFKVIGEGEELIQNVGNVIQEDSKLSFAVGLVLILISVTLLLMRNGII